ncbi:MAG: hypothetical protein WKF84_00675 [Pyrinomonadaceae bacterium]
MRQSVAVTARLSRQRLGHGDQRNQSADWRADVRLPPGMTIEYGGLYREQQAIFP